MKVNINTAANFSDSVALDILNVAINGGCDSWAIVTDLETSTTEHPLYASAKFTIRSNSTDPVFRTVITREIGAGIQILLADGADIPASMREKILRIVANNDATEVDTEVANCIVRAVLTMSGSRT